MGKRRRELSECATSLLALNLNSSVEEIQELIVDGYHHLRELNRCNSNLVAALAQRLDKAEYLLQQKREVSR